MLLQNLYPKGQNSVIPRPLAAGIGILKVLPVYCVTSLKGENHVTGKAISTGIVCAYFDGL
jgi:hypothetical protein